LFCLAAERANLYECVRAQCIGELLPVAYFCSLGCDKLRASWLLLLLQRSSHGECARGRALLGDTNQQQHSLAQCLAQKWDINKEKMPLRNKFPSEGASQLARTESSFALDRASSKQEKEEEATTSFLLPLSRMGGGTVISSEEQVDEKSKHLLAVPTRAAGAASALCNIT
jgi:hypothetical protein